ncbi:MAG: UDP-2,4-diacetamido-2,4,6-trideoxy-beta-L-altropyranose hydrolase [Caulobacter sp.]|nr:UDP-2,4-diacetamido-2,4,6-trideoxy-beta-L-altropyranose hydrolase [Caulobacter sp.]
MSRTILFVCDAGPEVGGGHVMRCLTLAAALSARGARCRFLAPPPVGDLLEAFAPDLDRIAVEDGQPDRLIAACQATDADMVVFDHYGLGAADHRAGAGDRPAMVIDDLADRPLGADLLLDSGLSRASEDYDGLVQEACRRLIGPAFAPVRPGFCDLRQGALARRLSGPPPGRILVSLGLGDLNAITGRVVERLLPVTEDMAIDVVLGGAAPSLSKVSALALVYPRVSLHIDTPDMAGLVAAADIAVGGGGSSSWERCVLGLPTVLLILADNQRPSARALEAAGAALALEVSAPEFEGALQEDVIRLMVDDRLRLGMSLAAAEVCDGLGADRVADAVMELLESVSRSPGEGGPRSGSDEGGPET